MKTTFLEVKKNLQKRTTDDFLPGALRAKKGRRQARPNTIILT